MEDIGFDGLGIFGFTFRVCHVVHHYIYDHQIHIYIYIYWHWCGGRDIGHDNTQTQPRVVTRLYFLQRRYLSGLQISSYHHLSPLFSRLSLWACTPPPVRLHSIACLWVPIRLFSHSYVCVRSLSFTRTHESSQVCLQCVLPLSRVWGWAQAGREGGREENFFFPHVLLSFAVGTPLDVCALPLCVLAQPSSSGDRGLILPGNVRIDRFSRYLFKRQGTTLFVLVMGWQNPAK